jgi:hypothetical protein
MNLFRNNNKPLDAKSPPLKPVKKFEAEREFYNPNAKGNEQPLHHYISAMDSIEVGRKGPYIPLLKRDITKLRTAYETHRSIQPYSPYHQAMDGDGAIVSLEEAMQRLDAISLENLIANFREHRHGHLSSFYYPY